MPLETQLYSTQATVYLKDVLYYLYLMLHLGGVHVPLERVSSVSPLVVCPVMHLVLSSWNQPPVVMLTMCRHVWVRVWMLACWCRCLCRRALRYCGAYWFDIQP